MSPLFGALGPTTILLIVAAGVILFGRKLPEIGRLLGLSVVEFKKGLHGAETEVETGTAQALAQPERGKVVPRFDPLPASGAAAGEGGTRNR